MNVNITPNSNKMSINVHVSGNPISIKRGKMITDSYDQSNKEFEKRRLIRLGQVRQQSKDIAENIRNKLKTDKTKRLSSIEKEGEIQLQNWQAKKLLQLQNQYQDALENIGLGHKEAAQVEEDDEMRARTIESNSKVAKERGRLAEARMQVSKNEKSIERSIPIQRKKLSRDLENARANSLAKQVSRNSVSKGKQKAKDYDSDGENRVPQLFDLSEEGSMVESPQNAYPSARGVVLQVSQGQQTSKTYFEVPKIDKSAQTSEINMRNRPHPTELSRPNSGFSKDTRISERIRRRRLNQPGDYCEEFEQKIHSSNTLQNQSNGDQNHLFSTNTKCDCCHCPENQKPQSSTFHNGPNREIDTQKRRANPPKETTYQSDYIDYGSLVQIVEYSEDGQNEPIFANNASKEEIIYQNRDFVQESKPQIHENVLIREKNQTDNQYIPKTLKNKQREPPETNQTENQDIPKIIKKQPSKTSQVENVDILKSIKNKQREPSKTNQIPQKPKITLRSSKVAPEITRRPTQNDKIAYYDHPNRFSKDFIPETIPYQTIKEEDIHISPLTSENDEMAEKMRQRDIEAQIRGQIAIEKEKMAKEYKELIRKLPILQKQERIGDIGADKPEYHMDYDRLDAMSKKRQNQLDNNFEEVFVRSEKPLITTEAKSEQKEQILQPAAEWDTDSDGKRVDKHRTSELSAMLAKLKHHKSDLINDIEKTLSYDTIRHLTRLLSDEDIQPSKRKRKEEPPAKQASESSSSSESPRKKPKLKRKKTLVLQNTSTQTTPTISQQPSKVGGPALDEEMCEIVIKLSEDTHKPEVVVNPAGLAKNIRVVTEESKKQEEALPEKVPTMSQKSESTPASPKRSEATVRTLLSPQKKSKKRTDSSASPPKRSEKSSKTRITDKKSEKSSNTRITDNKSSTLRHHGSWRSELSTNSLSTNTTSYYDPPDFATLAKKAPKSEPKPKSRPKQRSFDSTVSDANGAKRIDPRLLTYIKKLLDMSRTSLDNLPVSSVSEVSTPSQSVVEMPTNNPMAQLKNVLKYFDLNYEDVQRELSQSQTQSNNTSGKTTDDQSSQFLSVAGSSRQQLAEYADVAANCTRKISDLTAMIEQVRAEKKKILDTGSGHNSEKEETMPKKKDGDSDLVQIDYEYASNLKNLELKKKEPSSGASVVSETDDELLQRLRKLLEPPPIESFEPMMLQIPKLPKFDASCNDTTCKKRPPPSKGLSIFNGETPAHELSTIVEGDSQLSGKLESPVKKPTISPIAEASKKSTSSGSTDLSDMETMETMLQSIGMEWAIPTLRKTREALENSTSNTSKESDATRSLREVLNRISSSSSTEVSGGMSLIGGDQRDVTNMGQELDDAKTSTPIRGVQMEEMVRYGQPKFHTDSDISSVREDTIRKDENNDNSGGSRMKHS